MTYGKKLDIDRLVDGINLHYKRYMTQECFNNLRNVLSETFPEVLWTQRADGLLDAQIVSNEYRP